MKTFNTLQRGAKTFLKRSLTTGKTSNGSFTSFNNLHDYVEFDQKHVMHPYTSMTKPLKTNLVRRAEGVYIYLEDGSDEGVKVIDGMSSWWCMVHGYRNPVLDKAIHDQVKTMSHVMFGGLSHKPAIELCKMLIDITPAGLDKVFLCDSGSISVEVAMKMAIQYWFKLGYPKRSKLLTIRNSYHGDTFGAMSVCDPVNSMHSMFAGILAEHIFVQSPCINEEESIDQIKKAFDEKESEIAAVILEPIVQGAGGMNFYSSAFLREVRELCDKFDILLIFDEIATGSVSGFAISLLPFFKGFGRTGELFACYHGDGITPDLLCLGKALTGGYMTMGATLTNKRVSEGISRENGVFMHGPTFMGNPLAAAVSKASISLLMKSPWKDRVKAVERRLQEGILPLIEFSNVKDTRVLGAIGVCEFSEPVKDVAEVQNKLISNGVWLRPFGKLLYTMPPFNAPITDDQVDQITYAMRTVAEAHS